ncbi:hypothetical protein CEV31_4330 [Brucella thiophenivorans]|uniref:Uncharacterized protein n=2 Tax=Brucella thiophenivorans TaxID=571255 RepID=A0A256FRZ4_9HYPH|nr:hypothetical protein CEV31_4330 [Brucella thiophenivorans]
MFSQAHADTVDSLFANAGDACLPNVKVNLVDAIRNGIEAEVKRREQALKMPAPLSGLSCLDNLMDVNLDIAIQIPDVNGLFSKAMSDAENQLCSMAQEQIAKVTEPLQQALQIPQLQGLELPGMGASGGPDIEFGISSGGIGASGANVENTGARQSPASIMNELYNDLYGAQ